MKHLNENESDEYRKKREKNNESVRKSRAKNRVKVQECAKIVTDLRSENTQLNNKLNSLKSELHTLRGLFHHCFSVNLNNLNVKPADISTDTLYKLIMKNEPEEKHENRI
jgi:uncharacterized coiled-coil DUF342 family protein